MMRSAGEDERWGSGAHVTASGRPPRPQPRRPLPSNAPPPGLRPNGGQAFDTARPRHYSPVQPAAAQCDVLDCKKEGCVDQSVRDYQAVVASIEWHLGWHDKTGTDVVLSVWYCLAAGAAGRREVQVNWKSLDEDVRRRFGHLARWALDQIGPPDSYEMFGSTVRPTRALDVLHFPVFGATEYRPNTLACFTWDWHPDQKVSGPKRTWREEELPPEVQELARTFDEASWQLVRDQIARDFTDAVPEMPTTSPPFIYIAYRDGQLDSVELARRLNGFFISRRLRTFYAPWSIGWGAVLFDRMRREMSAADGAVLCFTADFLSGKTAREEYETFCKRLTESRDFRVGLILIGVPFEEAPPEMASRTNVSIHSYNGDFDRIAAVIYRGVLGLGQESL